MASPLHTDQLVVTHGLAEYDFSVPANERWVIRTITQFVAGGGTLGGFQIVEQGTNATLWWTQPDVSLTGQFQAWYDMRVVLKEGVAYKIFIAGGTDVGLFGFKLTLP